MGKALDIQLRVIPSKLANDFIRKHHYSGKTVNNSKLHFGVFYNCRLHGAMSFGSPLDKRKMLGLVEGTKWNSVLELNRMAFDDVLPRNSESRAIAIACRLIKKNAPEVKWIISFADGCSCGDGTIYRASGFVLTGIKKNANLAQLPDGTKVHKIAVEVSPTAPRQELGGASFFDVTDGSYNFKKYCEAANATILDGFQLRYIKFLDPEWRSKLTVPEIPFSKIDEIGARMYKGKKL